MVRVGIVGATGYTAEESLKILLRHNQAEVTTLTALPDECDHIAKIFPAFEGRLDIEVEPLDVERLAEQADVALGCLPHKVAMSFVPRLLDAGIKVIDFSADYRLDDVKVYEQYYEVTHEDAGRLGGVPYGLPELFREEIRGASLVANPGCFPTGTTLALAPLLCEKLIRPSGIVANAVTGVSGAGRKAALKFHYPEMDQNMFAYGIGTHRHGPEIEQICGKVLGEQVQVLFQPHVAALSRGILTSVYADPVRKVTAGQLRELFEQTYQAEPFVRVLDAPPTLRSIIHSNYCDVYPTVVKDKIVVFSAIDNLVKGAAGQAIQNMNLICGFDELEGLL